MIPRPQDAQSSRSLFPFAVLAAFTAALLAAPAARAEEPYVPADQGQRPPGSGTKILPEQFLRGFDPITAYFPDNVGPGRVSADDGAKRLHLAPSWPGAWVWADKKTLQFRPAEPWPPLARFSVEAGGARRVLTTMMSAPTAMSPSPGSDNLRPFRTVTLTFPQALTLSALKGMLKLEIRDLPGLADSPRRLVKEWNLAELPRANQRDPALYALTLNDDVPEGKLLQVTVSLALGEGDKVLWTGRAATRMPFHLEAVQCGAASFPLAKGSAQPRDLALSCGNAGEMPQLVFSAAVKNLGLTELKQLVRLEPAVPDLHFETYGSRVSLRGRFVPDTLYRLRLGPAAIQDDSGRALANPGEVELFFYLGWKSAFLRWSQSTATVEANGPRMVPLIGYGDPRADVRIYKIDPLYAGLWPFPKNPVVINEESPPPFPGEEPSTPKEPGPDLDAAALAAHLRLLGSPLVSRIVDLPLQDKGGSTRFGLDLGPLLDGATGRGQPGTYLVGVRRLSGPPERSYLRVQVTNLSVTTVEDHDRAVFFVRTLDGAEPVRGATIVLEGIRKQPRNGGASWTAVPDQVTATTDAQGRAELVPLKDWSELRRLSVRSGEDVLVLDEREPPPRFANNHWSLSDGWLTWLTEKVPPPANDKLLGFVFTERPLYKPGEPVFIKGYVRRKVGGNLQAPGAAAAYGLAVEGPDNQSWQLPVNFTPLAGFEATFDEKDLATGRYTVTIFQRQPYQVIATRPFQIEAYRVPTFEVRFSGPTAVRLDGPFKLKALARYYAGGSVAGQPIRWTVTQRPYYHVPKGREGFLFASSSQFARPESARRTEAISRAGTLDDSGADELPLNPALDLDGSARIYHFEATVTGPDNQEVSAFEEVKALPPFTLGLKVPRYLEKATELKPEILAVGVDDQPLTGQEVLVRLYRRVWHSHLRETNFATGKAQYVTEQEDVKLAEVAIKTEARPMVPNFPIKEAGVYVVELTGRDKLGRVQTLSADLYLGGPQPLAWQKSRDGVFEVTPDQKSYKPGDTAKLVVQSPFQTARALVIVEEPDGNRYSWVDVGGGKVAIPLKIDVQHVPNLPVHVVLLRGRLAEREPGRTGTAARGDDARYRPAAVAASLDLEVEPVRNQVLAHVSHPEVARPGSKVDFTITLTDDQKRPIGGEVTLWLVDEAVLSLAREEPLDPLTRLVDRNQRVSSIRDTRNTVIGRLVEQEEEPGGDGEGGEEGAGRTRVVRKNFKTVPYYKATLEVPASGRLTVPITLSDDLTNFKVRAVAASGMRRFGFAQSTLHVRLPVLIQPQLPRFVRQGDRFWAGGVARLVEGAEGPGAVDLHFVGPVDAKAPSQAIDLKQSRPASVLVPVTVRAGVPGGTSELTVRVGVTRKSDGVGDAFEVKLPVLPDRSAERVAFFDKLGEGPLPSHPFPEPPRPGTVVQDIAVSNVPGLLELAAGLDYLGQYPHGCLEQQMSQLAPEIAQGTLLHRFGLDTGVAQVNAAHVRKLLAELALFQDEQGLFAFWPGSKGEVSLTAQVVDFLQDVKRTGLPVDEKVLGRATEALKRALRSDSPALLADFRYNQQTEALHTLARAGQLDEHYLIELFQRRGDMDLSSVSTLAQAMQLQPQLFRQNLDLLREELWRSVVFKLHKGQPVFEGLNNRRTGWGAGFLGSNTSTLAQVFQSLVLLDPSNQKLGLVRDAVLASAEPVRGWGSTYENRRAIAALATYLDKATEPTPAATVTLSGPPAQLDSKTRILQKRLTSDAPVSGQVKGGPVAARIAYRYIPAMPGDHAAALKQGFVVSRGATLLPAAGGVEERFDDQAGATRKLAVGDILELHTVVVTDETRYQVALVVPFAAGLEPMNPELANASADARPAQADSTAPTYVQRLDNEVRYYFLQLPKGTHSFHFRVKAATEGSFVHPAPRAELMYRDEIRGRGEGMRIVVSGSHEK